MKIANRLNFILEDSAPPPIPGDSIDKEIERLRERRRKLFQEYDKWADIAGDLRSSDREAMNAKGHKDRLNAEDEKLRAKIKALKQKKANKE